MSGKDDDDGVTPFPGSDEIISKMGESAIAEKIQSLTKQNALLIKKNRQLREELEETNNDQVDVYVYLHRKLDENFDVIASLEGNVADLKQEIDVLRAERDRMLSEQMTTFTAEKTSLSKRVKDLEDELVAVIEFKEDRESYNTALKEVREQLAAEKAAREEEVTALERRNVAAKEKLKTVMFNKIKATKKAILATTASHLNDTTKRTMAENEQMTTELTYQSLETEKLIATNQKLREGITALRRETSLQRQANEELVKRTNSLAKLVKKLKGDIAVGLEREKELERGRDETSLVAKRDKLILSLQQQLEKVSATVREMRIRAEEAESTRDAAVSSREAMESLQDEAVRFLLTAVDDIRRQADDSAAAMGHSSSMSSLGRGKGGMGLKSRGGSSSLDKLPQPQRLRAVELLLAKMQLYRTALSTDAAAGWSAPASHRSARSRHTEASSLTEGLSLPPIDPSSGLPSVVGDSSLRRSRSNRSARATPAARTLPSAGIVHTPSGDPPHSPIHVTNQSGEYK